MALRPTASLRAKIFSRQSLRSRHWPARKVLSPKPPSARRPEQPLPQRLLSAVRLPARAPTAAFSDTTDTAADILAALPAVIVGSTFQIRIKNGTNYTETLLAGMGVTLPNTVIIPPLSVGNYYGTVTSATAVTLTHMSTTPLNPAGGVTTAVGGSIGGIATGTFSQASNTTLSSVTGMVAQVTAGATYAFDAYLAVTNSATGGITLKFGGTATATSFLADTFSYSGTTLGAETNVASIASNLLDTATAATVVRIRGTIVVNAGGTLQLQAAQHASNSTATTVTNGSNLVLTRLA